MSTARTLCILGCSLALRSEGWGGPETPATVTPLPSFVGYAECGLVGSSTDTVRRVFVDSVHAGGYSGCGAWVEIEGPADSTGAPRRIRAEIAGFYRGAVDTGAYLDILGDDAWKSLTGSGLAARLTGIPWRFVEAPIGEGRIVVRMGSNTNPYYAALELARYRIGIAKIEVSMKSGVWLAPERIAPNWWTWMNGGSPLVSPFGIRLTDVLGRTIEDEVSILFQSGASDTLEVQFPPVASVGTSPLGFRESLAGTTLVVVDLRGRILETRRLAAGETPIPSTGRGLVAWSVHGSSGIIRTGLTWRP